MRAPVYRQVDTKQALMGLASPQEFQVFIAGVYAIMTALEPGPALGGFAALYLGIRLVARGRVPQHFQHLIIFGFRRVLTGGVLSAAARMRQPRFPYAKYRVGAASERETPS